MTRRIATVAVLGALLLAACGSGDDPTLGAGTGEEAGEPGATSAPGATPAHGGGTADTAGGATPACSPSGDALAVTAKGIAWNTDCLAVAAGQPFTIALDNQDTVPHNVAILPGHSSTEVLFRGELLQGPGQTTYQVPALSPGTYVFHCEVHPGAMRGTFVVT